MSIVFNNQACPYELILTQPNGHSEQLKSGTSFTGTQGGTYNLKSGGVSFNIKFWAGGSVGVVMDMPGNGGFEITNVDIKEYVAVSCKPLHPPGPPSVHLIEGQSKQYVEYSGDYTIDRYTSGEYSVLVFEGYQAGLGFGFHIKVQRRS